MSTLSAKSKGQKLKRRANRIGHIHRFLFCVILAGACLTSLISAQAQQPDRNAVLNHLNAIINWYREATANVQPGELPSDEVFQQNVRSLAGQAVQLAFDFARAQAALLRSPNPSSGDTTASTQDYSQVQTQVSQRIADSQSKLEALNNQISAAPASKRKALLAQHDQLNGQIALDKAMLDAVQKMSQFVELNAASNQGLEGSIKELADSVPEVLAKPGSTAQSPAKPSQTHSAAGANSSGIIGQLVTLYDHVESMRSIDRLLQDNQHVIQNATTMREPLRSSLRTIIAQSQQNDSSTAPANGAAQPPDFAKITKQFNQMAAALIPLSQELIVLQQTGSNLQEWRNSLSSESKHDLFALLARVVGICLALAVVWGFSEAWRRLTFRYVQDARRRRQFLVLRRFVMGFFFSLVIVLGFVSQFSSLATYAGFVTAGIAVGLQTLLLSVAAYFFVVGRYGIRIGDRISVAGVTGDVVDVGLVRLYIMELAGTGVDLYPTGRIAVFSNSVLFQPTTPLYKQVPGTEYAWHEVSLTVAPGGNHKAVHEKALAEVVSVYDGYREEMERQQGTIGDRVEVVLHAPAPEAKFQFSADGLGLVIRYPVLLSRASEIDDHIAESLVNLITTDAEVKAGITGMPKIQAAVKG